MSTFSCTLCSANKSLVIERPRWLTRKVYVRRAAKFHRLFYLSGKNRHFSGAPTVTKIEIRIATFRYVSSMLLFLYEFQFPVEA